MSFSLHAAESAKSDHQCREELVLEAPVLQLAQYSPCANENARAGLVARYASFLAGDTFFWRVFSLSAAVWPRRKTRGPAMFKLGLTALVAIPLTFASAKAFEDLGAERAANAFAQFGLQGLSVAGRASVSNVIEPFSAPEAPPIAPRAYTPVCWTRYATVANGNTLMNVPYTFCR